MDFDFSAFLVLATIVTGGIWALDSVFAAPRRRLAAEQADTPDETGSGDATPAAPREPTIVEYARSFFPIILVVLILRSFLVEPFRIPSGSMMPTLLVGDFILVKKYAYGVRLPVLNTKILETGAPERGDVVVFRYPRDPSMDYIKRVIGLPGDVIGYFNKTVYVNGMQVRQVPDGIYIGTGAGSVMSGAVHLIENLGDVDHSILIRKGQPTIEGEYRVPDGHYFVMGDNRDNSNDSRFWGTVPEENLVGKAFVIWMNWDSGITWDRLGNSIQ